MKRLNLNTECPPALATEAEAVWARLRDMLRTADSIPLELFLYEPSAGPIFPITALYRYNAAQNVLTPIGELVVEKLIYEDKINFFAAIRQAIKRSGANCLFFAWDAWCSRMTSQGYPGRPSQAPDRRECLVLRVELQDGDGWNARQFYTRVGSKVFVPNAMPELRYQAAQVNGGYMQNWWMPTPVPANN